MDKFLNREASWIEFNARVLAEAMDPSNPLLERLKFLGIVSSNFDEFFMVRIPSLGKSKDLREIRDKAYALIEKENHYFQTVMVPSLEAAGIQRVHPQGLSEKHFELIRTLFHKELLPALTPIGITEDRPAPVLGNLSLYMIVALMETGASPKKRYAVIEIPRNFPRMISLPVEKGYSFILLEDVVTLFAKELFAGYEIIGHGFFRITRAAEMTLDEESDQDFAEVMAKALQTRRTNEVVRLETALSKDLLEILKKTLAVGEEEICRIPSWLDASWLDLKGISQLAFQPIFEDLKRPAWVPRAVPDFQREENLWTLLKKKDVLVMHPYETFDAVNFFLAEAAQDPDVLAIKMTLYRAGQDSLIISSLEKAAQSGKNVTVLVELKARFDEEKNITWANRLEQAGASVIYGLVGYKTHAKACLVVRREPEGIRRYFHLGTGNYNEKTSHIYSDLGLFSAQEEMASDLSIVFNMITGYSQPMALSKLVVAPYGLRRKLLQLISREILRSTVSRPGLIMAKLNSLVDPELIEALYKASKAGVKIKLNIRGICCLRPGVKDLSENIEVTSIVDMFLEHSRILYFHNGGDEEVYLTSADWMPRNLDRRVELMVPLEAPELKKECIELIHLYFKDNMKSWKLQPGGEYLKTDAPSEKKFRVQEFLCKKVAERESSEKTKFRELRPQRPKSRN